MPLQDTDHPPGVKDKLHTELFLSYSRTNGDPYSNLNGCLTPSLTLTVKRCRGAQQSGSEGRFHYLRSIVALV